MKYNGVSFMNVIPDNELMNYLNQRLEALEKKLKPVDKPKSAEPKKKLTKEQLK